ncbi:MAG: peroxiredoxin [Massilibacillus sp.]|jgi:peroxiredoxin|nr:peroxiredoxin [Massilibacillus sp.]
MKSLAIGDEAPNFTILDQNDSYIRLSDFRGKKVLLSWHPLAWTPVCTDQMRALEANWFTFEKLNTIPMGFSVDSAPSKKGWASCLSIKNMSLPADFWPHGKVAKEYGIFREQDGFSERANFIVDEEGKIFWTKIYPMDQLPDIDEILRVLAAEKQ